MALTAEEVSLGEVQALLAEGSNARARCTVQISRQVAIEYGPTAGQRISKSLRTGNRRGKGLVALVLLPVVPIIAAGDALTRAGRPSHREELVDIQVPALTLALAQQEPELMHALLVAGARASRPRSAWRSRATPPPPRACWPAGPTPRWPTDGASSPSTRPWRSRTSS